MPVEEVSRITGVGTTASEYWCEAAELVASGRQGLGRPSRGDWYASAHGAVAPWALALSVTDF